MPDNDVTSISIDRRARPLRLGFLVEPGAANSVRAGIEAATAIWGGAYCPLIPILKTTPTGWQRFASTRQPPSAVTITEGYVRLFEPDYLVETVTGLARGLRFPAERTLSLAAVFEPRGVTHGVSAADIYRALYTKEFRFLRRDVQPLVLPAIAEQGFELLSAAWFGAFAAGGSGAELEATYMRALAAQRMDITVANAYQPRGETPLHVGRFELDVYPRSDPPRLALLIMDHARALDVLDFWNLRALGWRVVPYPLAWLKTARGDMKSLIERVAFRDPPSVFNAIRFLPTQSLDEATFAEAIKPLQSTQTHSAWHPRLWDEWGRGADHIARPEIRAGEVRGNVELSGQYNSFELVVPDLLRHVDPPIGGQHPPTWATVVNLRSYSSTDKGTAFPSSLQKLSSLLRTMDPVWLSDEGIVVETSSQRSSELWDFPRGRDVFWMWANEAGFAYSESAPGRLLGQMVKRLGGIGGGALIRRPELLDALDQMAHQAWFDPQSTEEESGRSKARSGTISHEALRHLLRPLHAREIPPGTPADQRSAFARHQEAGVDAHISRLVTRDVLRVGLRVRCPSCSQWTWYGLDRLGRELECERCLEIHPFPAGRPTEAEWHYRPVGPFAVENYAHGSYAVLLTLRFLIHMDHPDGVSWSPSFELKKGNTTLEADFGAFVRPDRWMRTAETTLLLGECKSGNRYFDAKDYARARELLKTFPTAAMVFATTRPELTAEEKDQLRSLASEARNAAYVGQPSSPVVVLTRWELSSDWGAPVCWKGHPRFTPGMDNVNVRGSVRDLADLTQQLHLEMLSIDQEAREHYERERQQKKQSGEEG